jgi:tRNA threonylcarbamoyladenosine modification (KEOPS) complex  Pcc1 subunit
MIKIRFVFDFDSIKEAKVVNESLYPEIKNKISNIKADVFLSKKTFYLDIKAKNINSLRAACNSYLRWINTAINVTRTI